MVPCVETKKASMGNVESRFINPATQDCPVQGRTASGQIIIKMTDNNRKEWHLKRMARIYSKTLKTFSA
jgi:hypothetical protein